MRLLGPLEQNCLTIIRFCVYCIQIQKISRIINVFLMIRRGRGEKNYLMKNPEVRAHFIDIADY